MNQLTFDVVWNRLVAVVNEQAAALMRASFTSIVREASDLSAGVFNRRGEMLAQAATGTPGHIHSMATGMRHFLERFPETSLAPGDVLITNDPWKTASQLNDITVVTPVFHRGRLVAFFGNCCHALDIGGRGLSADSRSVFEEGLALPLMKLYRRGEPDSTLLELLAANVRTPEEVLGDLHSQVAANAVGARQLLALLEEFRLDDLEAVGAEILDRTEAALRDRIRALPEGVYRATLYGDGFGEAIAIQAAVTVRDGGIVVDYAGSSGPSPYGINVAFNYTRAYTTYGLQCALAPDLPSNQGGFRPIEVRAPEGCLLHARFPAAVAGRHLVGHFLPSALMTALAPVLPAGVQAPGFDALWDTHIAGETSDGRPFSYTWFASGGAGAMIDRDGFSATAFPSGVAGVPTEVIETLAPLLIRRRDLLTDSGGAGRQRGGLGQRFEIEVLSHRPFLFSGLYERIAHAAPGLAGGLPGAPGRLSRGDGEPLTAKQSGWLPAGTVVTLELPGGGGFGPPRERDRQAVRNDLRDGYISERQARDVYGLK